MASKVSVPVAEGEEQTPEASVPIVMKSKLAPETPSLAAPEALEMAIPTHMTPLHLQWEASRGFTSAGWRVAVRGHQSHVPQLLHMCAETSQEWDWHVPPATRLLSTQTPSGITRKIIHNFLVIIYAPVS